MSESKLIAPSKVLSRENVALLTNKRADDIVGVSTSESLSSIGIKIGDRVEASDQKQGTVRYIGYTEFAKGIWLGIELDEPKGKNDGSVNGKRYFNVGPNYGLFALIDKVTVLQNSGNYAIPSSRRGSHFSNQKMSHDYSFNESLESITSNSSNQVQVNNKNQSNIPMTANGRGKMQSLASPVDDFVRVRHRAEEAETQVMQLKYLLGKLQEDFIQLQTYADQLLHEKAILEVKLVEEKKKVEDLQFIIEEKNIDSSSIMNRVEKDESRLFELEEQLAEERSRRQYLEKKLSMSSVSMNSFGQNLPRPS